MKNGYHDRALKARDPRFGRIFDKLGYARRDMVPAAAPAEDISNLRETYERVIGKRPFNGWDAATLREKIAVAKGGD